MNVDKLSSFVSRLFFACAFILLGLAVLEKLANVLGYTIHMPEPNRLLGFAGILLIFVMTLLLREVREKLPRT